MHTLNIKQLRKWFADYVNVFYDCKADEDAVRLKDRHSRRVAGYMRHIGRDLCFDEHDLLLAETAGLFHDIGRFSQWKTYRTFKDAKSLDHGAHGCTILNEQQVLAAFSEDDKHLITSAIAYHNKRMIPENLDRRVNLFCRMLRDADKLDIFYLIHRSKGPKVNDRRPGFLKRLVAREFDGTDDISPEVLQALFEKRQLDMMTIRSKSDLALYHLGWIYDINYPTTARVLLARKVLDMLFQTLPKDDDTLRRLKQQLHQHLEMISTSGSAETILNSNPHC